MIGWLRGLFAKMFGGAGPEPDVWHFQIKGDRKEIGALNDALERAAAGGSVPEAPMRAIQVALDELLTNCISYAPISAASPAKVDIIIERKALRATITYKDKEFNPLERATPDTDQSIAERDIGGLGIHLVKEMMDEFTHRYEDGHNILTIGKRY